MTTYRTAIDFGVFNSPKNLAHIDFYYAGSGSNNNRLNLGFHSVNDILSITANRRVGIGTTAPNGIFHINDNLPIVRIYDSGLLSGEKATLRIGRNDSDNKAFGIEYKQGASNDDSLVSMHFYGDTFGDSLVLKKGGRVGIGTTSPVGGKLHLHSDDHFTYQHVTNADSDNSGSYFGMAYDEMQFSNWEPGNITFYHGTTQNMTIDPNGDVGIGTNPDSRLHLHKSSSGSSSVSIRFTNGATSGDGALIGINSNENLLIQNLYTGGDINFRTNGSQQMTIRESGNVGIGTASPSHELSVNGTIQAKEIIVETGWSDFVFEDDYELMTLDDVEQYIDENGHLPDVPSAGEVASNGVSLGESQSILLQKIEELTLHLIEQNKRINELENQVASCDR